MKLKFNPAFAAYGAYLENAINQPSHFENVEAMMKDLLGKEVTHGDVLEHGVSSPMVALAHLVNNPHLIDRDAMKEDIKIETPDDQLDTRVDVAVGMLCRSAVESIDLAPIDNIPLSAVKILGRALQTLDLSPSHRPFGKLLVSLLDRSQHLEPEHQKDMQALIQSGFAAFRKTYGVDAVMERELSVLKHGETAHKLVTLLDFDPENVKGLTHKERRGLQAAKLQNSEPAYG